MFYDRFVQLCKQKGVSPSRAAVEAGISKSLVSKWKANGAKDPSAEVLRKLASYFHIPVSQLLEENRVAEGEHTVELSDVDFAFYGGYKELNEDDQATIRDMVRLMRQRRKNQV